MGCISYEAFTEETESDLRYYKTRYARATHPWDQFRRGMWFGKSLATYFIWVRLTRDEQNAGDVARLRSLLDDVTS
jgi:hypothetical protein